MDTKYLRCIAALQPMSARDLEVDDVVRRRPPPRPKLDWPGRRCGLAKLTAPTAATWLAGANVQYLPDSGAGGEPFTQAINTLSDVSLLLVRADARGRPGRGPHVMLSRTDRWVWRTLVWWPPGAIGSADVSYHGAGRDVRRGRCQRHFAAPR